MSENFKIMMAYGLGINPARKDKAFTGVSIALPFFKKGFDFENEEYHKNSIKNKGLPQICEWALKRFDRFLVLIGDSLLQYNFMAFCNFGEKDAREKAVRIGDFWYKFCTEETERFQQRIKLIRWLELAKDKKFIEFVEKCRNFAFKNPYFKASLRALTITSIPSEFEEMSKKYDKRALENALGISAEYSAEEVAGLLYVNEMMDYRVCLSKYEPVPIIKSIYGGHYPELYRSLGLKEFGHIQLSQQDERVHCDDEFEEVYRSVKILGNLEALLGR